MKFRIIKNITKTALQILLNIIVILSFLAPTPVIQLQNSLDHQNTSNKVSATSQYTATGGLLETGTEVTVDAANLGSWRGTLGDDNNYWTVARNNPGGLSQLLYFDGVQEYGANKLIVYIYASNITTGNTFEHQICDWTSSTSVDYTADSNCTGGGWRILSPRKQTDTTTTESNFVYELYDGYYSTRSATPGTPISTPLSNFIRTSDKRILVRTYSTVASSVVQKTDLAQVEVAIDPVYEPAAFVKTAGGTTTGFISDTIGATGTGVTGSDNNKFGIPNSAANTPMDFYFVFKNVQKYTGANTILFVPEIAVSNVGLTFEFFIRDFTSGGSWKQAGGVITATSTADFEYGTAFNSTSTSGFDITNSISSSDEVWIRITTNGPATARTMSIDRLYMMLGSVNTDSSLCQISWGTGTATNCTNTRSIVSDVVS